MFKPIREGIRRDYEGSCWTRWVVFSPEVTDDFIYEEWCDTIGSNGPGASFARRPHILGLAILENNDEGNNGVSRAYMESLGCWNEFDIQESKQAGEITEKDGEFFATEKLIEEWRKYKQEMHKESMEWFDRETRFQE